MPPSCSASWARALSRRLKIRTHPHESSRPVKSQAEGSGTCENAWSMNDTVVMAPGVLNSSTSLVTNSVVNGPGGLNVACAERLDDVGVTLLLICATGSPAPGPDRLDDVTEGVVPRRGGAGNRQVADQADVPQQRVGAVTA